MSEVNPMFLDRPHKGRHIRAFEVMKKDLLEHLDCMIEDEVIEGSNEEYKNLRKEVENATQFIELFLIMQRLEFNVDCLVGYILRAYTGSGERPFCVPLEGWST